MTPTGLRISVQEYLALPEEKPYREYVYGEVVAKAMPNEDHIGLAGELIVRLAPLRDVPGGLLGPEPRVRFDTERGPEYRLPDVAYWRAGKPRRDGKELLPPTLAIELRSPEETMAEQRAKCRYYRRYGVDIAWLFDPATRTAEVFEGGRDGERLGTEGVLSSPLLPGLQLAVAGLFAVLDE